MVIEKKKTKKTQRKTNERETETQSWGMEFQDAKEIA